MVKLDNEFVLIQPALQWMRIPYSLTDKIVYKNEQSTISSLRSGLREAKNLSI